MVPELCEMTGLTDQHRADFRLMKDLSAILHKSAQERQNEVKNLIQEMESMTKVKEVMDKWKIKLTPNPLECEGQQIPSGDI